VTGILLICLYTYCSYKLYKYLLDLSIKVENRNELSQLANIDCGEIKDSSTVLVLCVSILPPFPIVLLRYSAVLF